MRNCKPTCDCWLNVGETECVRGPFGEACWVKPEPALKGPWFLVAEGTILAPTLPVLDIAPASGVPAEKIHVYYGVQAARDAYAESGMSTNRLITRISRSSRYFLRSR